MKKNILTGIITFLILILIVTVFFTKNTVDKKASKLAQEELPKILENIKPELEALDLPSSFTYKNISVSSTGGHLLLEGVNVTDYNGDNISFDEIKIGTSYKELFTMIKTKNFNEINSFYLEFKNINVIRQLASLSNDFSNHKIANNIRVEYVGSLTRDIINNIEYDFPKENQKLKIEIDGFNIPEEEYYLLEFDKLIDGFNPNMLKTDLSFLLEFLPNKKQFAIKNVYSKNKLGYFEGDFIIKYSGNNPSNVKPIKVSAKGKSDIDYKGMEIGDQDMSMKLGRGDMNFDFSISGNLYDMNEDEILQNTLGDIDISLKNISIKPSYEFMKDIQRDLPGFTLKNNKLDVSNIGGSIKWNGKNLETSLDFSSSLASLMTNIDMGIIFNRNGEPIPRNIKANGQTNFDFDNMIIGDNEVTFTLGNGDAKFNFSISGNINNMREDEIFKNMIGDFDVSFKNFNLTPSNELIREIQRDLPGFSLKNNKVTLKDFNQNFKWDGRRLINNMNIFSSLATIKSNIDMNLKFDRRGEPDIENSTLNKCMLRISGLEKNLNEFVENFENEMLMGQSLPRRGNDIVLNITGSFNNPKIEGINF